MGKLEVKKIVRRCVSRWSGKDAKQKSKLASLKTVTAATRRTLAREINKHADLKACAPVIRDAQIQGSMTVTALGDRVWNSGPTCLGNLP